MLAAPLEQFQILSLVPLRLFYLDFSITNFVIISGLAIFIILNYITFSSSNNNYLQQSFFYFSPNSWQQLIEYVMELPSNLVSSIILSNNERFFPVISTLFMFILFSNLIGLIPYTFTATSHLFVTFTLSFSVFIGINVVTFKKYKLKMFALFLPANTPFALALLLVPIEFVSYIAKPISLGVRLFINLMAGHTLLKVIIGFSWSILLVEQLSSIGLLAPMITLVVLFGLELAVALIQTYVFIVLTCIYIQDAS